MDNDTLKQKKLSTSAAATASAMSVYDDIDMDYIKPSSDDLKTLNHQKPILNPRKRARTNN